MRSVLPNDKILTKRMPCIDQAHAMEEGYKGPPTANQLLAALPTAVSRRLSPYLEETTLSIDQALFQPAAPLQFAYFPTNSIVTSSYAIDDNSMVKAWPVGREGMVGISLLLDWPNAIPGPSRADVELSGRAFRLSTPVLRREFRRAGALQHLLLRYVAALMTQASQLSVCNLYHSVDQRLCRFLSRGFDQVNGDQIFITQARLGRLLGIRREGVTESALRLQESGVIAYHRGHIRLLNRKALEARACICAGIIRRAFTAVTR
jgi:hypothetical protein